MYDTIRVINEYLLKKRFFNMVKQLLISSLFFSSMLMGMEARLATVLGAIGNFFSSQHNARQTNGNRSWRETSYSALQIPCVFSNRESDEANEELIYNALFPKVDTTKQHIKCAHCVKIIPITILATLAGSMLFYRIYNTH